MFIAAIQYNIAQENNILHTAIYCDILQHIIVGMFALLMSSIFNHYCKNNWTFGNLDYILQFLTI